MGLAQELASHAGIPIVRRSSLELIACEDAGRFLTVCEHARVWIVGIEGFRLWGDKTEPDMEAIADFSALEERSDRVQASIADAWRYVRVVCGAKLFLEFDVEPDESVVPSTE